MSSWMRADVDFVVPWKRFLCPLRTEHGRKLLARLECVAPMGGDQRPDIVADIVLDIREARPELADGKLVVAGMQRDFASGGWAFDCIHPDFPRTAHGSMPETENLELCPVCRKPMPLEGYYHLQTMNGCQLSEVLIVCSKECSERYGTLPDIKLFKKLQSGTGNNQMVTDCGVGKFKVTVTDGNAPPDWATAPNLTAQWNGSKWVPLGLDQYSRSGGKADCSHEDPDNSGCCIKCQAPLPEAMVAIESGEGIVLPEQPGDRERFFSMTPAQLKEEAARRGLPPEGVAHPSGIVGSVTARKPFAEMTAEELRAECREEMAADLKRETGLEAGALLGGIPQQGSPCDMVAVDVEQQVQMSDGFQQAWDRTIGELSKQMAAQVDNSSSGCSLTQGMMITDVLMQRQELRDATGDFGPYLLLVGKESEELLDGDYAFGGGNRGTCTFRERLLRIEGVEQLRVGPGEKGVTLLVLEEVVTLESGTEAAKQRVRRKRFNRVVKHMRPGYKLVSSQLVGDRWEYVFTELEKAAVRECGSKVKEKKLTESIRGQGLADFGIVEGR